MVVRLCLTRFGHSDIQSARSIHRGRDLDVDFARRADIATPCHLRVGVVETGWDGDGYGGEKRAAGAGKGCARVPLAVRELGGSTGCSGGI